MNLLAGKRDPLDFFLLALRSGYFFPGKLIINQKTLKRYQLVVQQRNKAFSKIWSLSTPDEIKLYVCWYASMTQAPVF